MAAFTKPKLLYISAHEAQNRIRNVFCVGRNYVNHAAELGNAVPEQPMIFTKPTHALIPCENKISLSQGRNNIHHELEIVLFLHRDYDQRISLSQLIGGVALGLDLTDRDLQNQLKAKGHPWELAKGFRNSAVITDFYQVEDWDDLVQTPFSLLKNGVEVQRGQACDMIFDFARLLNFIGEHFGLKSGDAVYTGTPAGVGAIGPEDVLDLKFNDETWGTARFTEN